MSALHSVWLMPAVDDERALSGIVAELADRFGSPRFAPHLTLMNERPDQPEALAVLWHDIADGIAPFGAEIAAVETGPAFFRSLYARFAAEGPLARLRQRSEAALSLRPGAPFMPHVSLAYGLAEGSAKERARRELAERLAARPIRFDRIGIVHSAETIAIADWRVAASFPLGGRPLP